MILPYSVQEGAYRLFQSVWSPWIRYRHRGDFDRVTSFCLFAGYPRSGHSLVGAVLNAHRDAVISHELDAHRLVLDGCSRDTLYARILARAHWFNLRGNTSNYCYQVPNQWQGRFASLRVVGDKRGGGTARCLAVHPDLLQRARAVVGVPLRVVHVVRNPFDNISAISIDNALTLEESIDYYFFHCQATSMLDGLCDRSELATVYHEEMIRDPRAVLSGLCRFLGLETYPGYLEDCSRLVFRAPTYTRRKLAWPAALILEVDRRAKAHRFLEGYEFDIVGEPGAS